MAHLLGSLEIEGIVGHLQPLLVLDIGVGLDAEEDVLDSGLVAVDVVDVVGGDKGDFEVTAKAEKALVYRGQHVEVVALDLQVVVLEDFAVPAGGGIGVFHTAFEDSAGDLGGKAAGEDYEALVVLFEEGPVHAGLVVEALHVGLGDQLYQVAVAGLVLGQDGQVVGRLLGGGLGTAVAVGDVYLTTDDGLDAGLAGSGIEIDGAVEVAVVG